MRRFTGGCFFFALAEKPIHLRDDRFQLPGVLFALRALLKLTPTFRLAGEIGPIRPPEFRSWHLRRRSRPANSFENQKMKMVVQ